jgi:hypothetical protein
MFIFQIEREEIVASACSTYYRKPHTYLYGLAASCNMNQNDGAVVKVPI